MNATPPLKETAKPLCVDLDGTLVKSDTLAESLLMQVRARPLSLFTLPFEAARGLAALKARLARAFPIDPKSLPYHPDLMRRLCTERDKGRDLILVTASDCETARSIAAQSGIFSDVIASDGTTNLKGSRKRDALVARFGEKGFDYAGNSPDDIPVWEAADRIIAVNPSSRLMRVPLLKHAVIIDDRPAVFPRWIRAIRAAQWLKNLLIFLPMLLAHEVCSPLLFLKAMTAFAAFSLAASAVYLCNDLLDLPSDRRHPRKCHRPVAAGHVDLLTAARTVPLLALASLALALLLPRAFIAVLILYLLITALYSWRLKQWPLLDVITLAGLYALRILAGTAAYGVESSPWLIAFSIFVFFSLALVKRFAELMECAEADLANLSGRGRGYRTEDLPLLRAFGAASGCTAVLVLALYINSDKVLEFYPRPHILWILCPLFLYWITRIWVLAGRGELHDDPLAFAVRDRATWLIGALSAATLLLAAL